MTTQVTDGTNTVTPVLVDGYKANRQAASIVHTIIDRDEPDVTLRPSLLRTGDLRFLFTTDSDASAAVAMLSAGKLLQLTSDERPISMWFVVTDSGADMELDDETRDVWWVSFPFQEVAAP